MRDAHIRTKHSNRAARAALAVVLALGGCTVGPEFVPPQAGVPAVWHDPSAQPGGAASTGAEIDPHWWHAYGDPTLNSLIERALAGNLTAGQTVYRIAESRAQERAAGAAALPSLKAKGSVTHEKIGEGSIQALGGALLPPGTGSISSLIKPVDLFDAEFDASWELDLFGKVRRSVEQARAQTAEQIESRNDALVSLEAEVARTYFQLRANQTMLAGAEEAIKDQAQIVALTRRQRELGVATDLDVDQALSRLTQTQAQQPQFRQAAEQAMNSLAVLIGQQPGSLDAELSVAAPLPAAPSTVAVSLPSALARRRPDIRKAEAHLHAATANIGVAVAQLYPQITLSAQTGQQALSLQGLTSWSSNFYQFGPSISLPIFDGGRLRANIRLAKAEQAEVALSYRQTVLNALQDVENDLVALRADRQRLDSYERAVAIADHQMTLAKYQYQNGVTTFLALLEAETTLVNARLDVTRSRLQVALDTAALSKAVGGGWEEVRSPQAALGDVVATAPASK